MCLPAKWLHPVSLIFRVAGIGLAAVSAAAMLTASQCTVYADYGWRPRTVTYSDFPAFVYLVAATAIATLLEAVALFLSWSKKGKSKKSWRVLTMLLLGAVVPALLYTSAGAAFAVGWEDIYYYLEPIGRRFSVCRSSVAGGRFCEHVHVSMWLALGAAVAVSFAEFLTTFRWCHGSGSCSDSDSDSDSDSESGCGHGCHCKH
ncbi:CASP-like protein 1U4 [Sorghum bicolor]|uniref:CASP-like protein 1U4 n=1 Tax=Sorghum bicolor TaxID=4558 RepID=CSPLF_SORBI|nr:CASP-like protein 1U4 [Sorghum bicolor]C5Y7C8.1 RecName: Full=CASP-like protein 1U4; Short=SbCASPL1U4 [Sorghum bicolor]EES10194.1 hypothetical protein SORBI_3005G202400 [Sorghum bicolor]|eukprot:XP_002451206.1 CASP-like protein 1U4 [Sorghum bicolor]